MSAALPLLAPRTRADCVGAWAGIRPTPACNTCRYRIERSDACSLDAASRGGMTYGEVASLFALSRERIRQVEQAALGKLRLVAEARGLALADLLPSEHGEADVTAVRVKRG